MEWITKLCWLAIAAIHFTPSLPLVRPGLIGKLYNIEPSGALGLLLTHRAAFFAIVLLLSIWAVFDANVRRVATVVAGVSMLSFLILYARAGMPAGALKTIALVDLVGVAPLIWVAVAAWRPTA